MLSDERWLYLFMGVIFVAVVVGFWVGDRFVRPMQAPRVVMPENPKGEQIPLRVGAQTIQVEVRDDPAGRALGLSGRDTVPAGEGMAFVFEEPVQQMFWMKDMLIPIDIVWVRNGRVLQIDENIPPPTAENPEIATASPRDSVELVLELAAGEVDVLGIQIGDEVEFVE